MIKIFDFIGEITLLSWAAFKRFWTGRQDWGLIIEQLSKGGVDSWSITILTAIFTWYGDGRTVCDWVGTFWSLIYTGKLYSLRHR